MTIEITQDDIERGERCQPGKCPLAFALKRNGFVAPQVHPHYVTYNVSDRRHKEYLSCEMAEWIKCFDYFGHATPRKFWWPDTPTLP